VQSLQKKQKLLVVSGFAESPGFKPLVFLIRAIRKIRIPEVFFLFGCGLSALGIAEQLLKF
jgi:hypothetical protein